MWRARGTARLTMRPLSDAFIAAYLDAERRRRRSAASAGTASKGSARSCSRGSTAITSPSAACRCSRCSTICASAASWRRDFRRGHRLAGGAFEVAADPPLLAGEARDRRRLWAVRGRAGGLGAAVRAVPALGWRGVNVTVPHKVAVMAHLDRVDDLAAKVGAVNTVVVEDGGAGRAIIPTSTGVVSLRRARGLDSVRACESTDLSN